MRTSTAPISQLSSAQDRTDYWDNLKGLLILLVVLGHFIQPYDQLNGIWAAIYLFHMPAFLFVTGFFSRRSSMQADKLMRFCILLIVYNIILMVGKGGLHPSAWEWYKVYLSAWYLLAVILYRLTIPLLERIHTWYILAISVCVGLCWGILTPSDPSALYKLVPLYPFFVLGYSYGTGRERNFVPPFTFRQRTLGGIVLLGLLLLGLVGNKYGILTYNRLIWAPYYEGAEDAIVRLGLYVCGILGTLSIMSLTGEKHTSLITEWGKNSLILYILHRPITLVLERLAPAHSFNISAEVWVISGILITLILGNNRLFVRLFNASLDTSVKLILRPRLTWISLAAALALCAINLGGWYGVRIWKSRRHHPQVIETDYCLNTLGEKEKQILSSSFRLSFIGDLILLRPQVQRGITPDGRFDFSPIFKHAKKYFQTDDYTIAVWEGPCAGSDTNYSNTAYGDKPFIRLNFPDEFATAAKEAGIDFVSVSTNHVLDCGEDAANRTLSILEQNKLSHVGVYPPQFHRNKTPRHRIISLRDESGASIRIAVLAYTYGSNYVPVEAFFTGEYKELVSCLTAPGTPYYEMARKQVLVEIEEAKKDNPDCLIIMPHMGGQFNHAPDEFQRHWCQIFINAGADVILSAHPHTTQPCEWFTRADGGSGLIIHCPGNFVDSYTDMDVDAVAITEIYLDKQSGKPQSCGVIPMWVTAEGNGQYIPAPLPEYLYGEATGGLSNMDYKRLEEVSRIITKSMLGREIPLHSAATRYYTFPACSDGQIYRDTMENKLPRQKIIQSALGKYLQTARKVCFVGDSITEGTKNMGYGWFEPIAANLPDIQCTCFAKGAMTSRYFLANATEIAAHKADVYVMAYGTNDVRYRNKMKCAMSAEQYVRNISALVNKIRKKVPNASFVFIAPWTSDIDDRDSQLSNHEKYAMLAEYGRALEQYCTKEGHWYINPNPHLRKELDSLHTGFRWLVDDIHPNGTTGIRLYSEAVLKAAETTKPAVDKQGN